jgi:hypothetical protein
MLLFLSIIADACNPRVRRHLLRLWLRNEDLAWKLPEPLKENWERLYYTAKEDEQRFPLEPEIRQASHGKNGKVEGGKYV